MSREYSNEFNTVTVEKIVILMEEIAVLESRYEDNISGNFSQILPHGHAFLCE